MHNEQFLPLFCGSAFCAGAHRQRCGSGRIEALWSPFTWRCKREPAWRRAGKVRAAPLAWRRKRCGSSSAVASIMRLIRRRRRRVAHPQVRASGAHPGLQVLWFVPHWGISVAVALHVEGAGAVWLIRRCKHHAAHLGLQVL